MDSPKAMEHYTFTKRKTKIVLNIIKVSLTLGSEMEMENTSQITS